MKEIVNGVSGEWRVSDHEVEGSLELVGRFVTAKLTGKEDCRQGWVISNDPLRIRGESGTEYACEGVPVIVINPPDKPMPKAKRKPKPVKVKAKFTPGPIPGSGRPNVAVKPDTVTIGGFVESEGMVAYLYGWSGQGNVVTGRTSRVHVKIPVADLCARFIHRYDIDKLPGNPDTRLPYDFDLFYDIKWLSDLPCELNVNDNSTKIRKMMEEHGITVKQAKDAYKAHQAWSAAESSRELTEQEKLYEVK